jgi:hypothetical protein
MTTDTGLAYQPLIEACYEKKALQRILHSRAQKGSRLPKNALN